MPLAGKDKSFEERGLCKPLVNVAGKPAIQWIAESRPFDYRKATFILLKEHQLKHRIDERLKEIIGVGENLDVIWVDKPTEGAPHSVLLAKDLIDNDEELIIDLPDQYLDLPGFMEFIKENKSYDGIIASFKSSYWNRGYMVIDENGHVKRVSEKDKVPISNDSTACVSYFKKGRDFVWAAEEMIKKNKRAANGAFLISLAYNELIDAGKKIGSFPCEFISTLGTLEGINAFEQHLRPLKSKKSI